LARRAKGPTFDTVYLDVSLFIRFAYFKKACRARKGGGRSPLSPKSRTCPQESHRALLRRQLEYGQLADRRTKNKTFVPLLAFCQNII